MIDEKLLNGKQPVNPDARFGAALLLPCSGGVEQSIQQQAANIAEEARGARAVAALGVKCGDLILIAS